MTRPRVWRGSSMLWGVLAAAILPFSSTSPQPSTSRALKAHTADGKEAGRVVKRLHASSDVTIISLADTGSDANLSPISMASMPPKASSSTPETAALSDNNGGNNGGMGNQKPQGAQQGGGSGQNLGTNVVFAVLTGKEHHEDRAEAVKATWCADINACIFFSDTPSETLPTVSISFEGLPAGLSKYSRAQLRYVPVLNYMRELMTSGQDELFQHSKWLVIVDDDTFVFHHNLASYLHTLDASLPIYTGDVVPDEWLPVSRDGMGNELGVSSPHPFVNGGGGSVFSRGALERMNTEHCVNASMPGQAWWRWQSDWMIGACAAEAGIAPMRQPQSRFNQFVCSDVNVQFCEGVEVAEYVEPSTLHPIRLAAQMKHIYQYYSNPSFAPVPRVRMRRVAVADTMSAAPTGRAGDKANTGSFAASSGLELS